MKKSDLKGELVLEERNGCITILSGDYSHQLIHFNEDLTHHFNNLYDIVKVYKLETVWERKEQPKLSKEDNEVLKGIKLLYPYMNWVARDKSGDLVIFSHKPRRNKETWFCNRMISINIELLNFVKWEDKEPYNIDELLKEEKNERTTK